MLVLHVLMVWAFIIEPPIPTPLQQEVRVTLVLSGASPQLLLPPPRPPPLLTPRLAAIASPEVTILTPPPPSTTVPLAAPGPAMPAISPAPLTRKPPPEYLSRLAAYLNGFKNYPYGARQRREQGTVRLHFVMDRAGNVLSFQVAGSSGWSDLDDEARALILRAQPLPPVPRNYPGQTLDLIVPIVFSLR